MEIFKNKFLVKLIATICLFLTLMNFGVTNKVYAKDEDVWGGVLIKPIVNLMTAIGDMIMETLHSSIQEQKQAIIKLNGSSDAKNAWFTFGAIVVGIVCAIAFIGLVVATGGTIAAAAAAVGVGATFTIGMGTVVTGAVVGIIAGTSFYKKWIPDDLYLPVFSISAEEIFANEIHLFDVNFFKPKEPKIVYTAERIW